MCSNSVCNLSRRKFLSFPFHSYFRHIYNKYEHLASKPEQIRSNSFIRWITRSHWFKHTHTDTRTCIHTQMDEETLGMTTAKSGDLLNKCNILTIQTIQCRDCHGSILLHNPWGVYKKKNKNGPWNAGITLFWNKPYLTYN